MLAVTGVKEQGGSVVLASPREEILNSPSSKPCCSAYFGVSYDIIIVTNANVSVPALSAEHGRSILCTSGLLLCILH